MEEIVECRPSVAKVTHFLRSRARLAVSTAASASRLARAPARRTCCQLHRWCTSRPRRSDARPRCALARCDTSVSAVWLERVSAIRTSSEARAAAAPYADSSAWRHSCRAPRRATVDDDGGRGSTARNARRVDDRSLKLLSRSVYSENGERAQRKLSTRCHSES